jgi:predicted anti-sigma-YlaC factor YlaD
MTCREVVELVTAYLEGAMTGEERASFEEHLALCEGCERYLAQMQRAIDLVGEVDEESLSPRTRQRLLDAFAGWNPPGSPAEGA